MTLILQNKCGLTVNYNTNDIISIKHDVAGNLYGYSVLEGYGVKPDDPVLVISFKDLTQITFNSDWKIVFQEGKYAKC